jgi:hypothetical protein
MLPVQDSRPCSGLLACAFLAFAGCTSQVEMTVDAIRGTTMPALYSYRLEPTNRAGGVPPELWPRVLAAVRQALAYQGCFEAPTGSAPDQHILIEAGVGPATRKIVYDATVEPHYRIGRNDRKLIFVHEKYVRLSARRGSPTGEELWSVHVSVEDELKSFEPRLAVLAVALAEHAGDRAFEEKRITVRPPKGAP